MTVSSGVFICRPSSFWSSPEQNAQPLNASSLSRLQYFNLPLQAPLPPPPLPLSAKLFCFMYQVEKLFHIAGICLSRLWWAIKMIVCVFKQFWLNISVNKHLHAALAVGKKLPHQMNQLLASPAC